MNVAQLERQAFLGDPDAQLSLARCLTAGGRRYDAEQWLRKAATTGNADAMMALGEHLLSRPPPVPSVIIEEGKQLIVAAAHKGQGDAAHFVSLLTAMHATLQGNWTYALAYLGRAAKSGHQASRTELAFLAGDDELVCEADRVAQAPPDIWQKLHDRIDLEAWLHLPSITRVSDKPAIATVKEFLPPRVCEWIIDRARPKLEPAKTYNSQDGKGSVGVSRTNQEMRFLFPELDLPIAITLHRISKLCGVPIQGMEPASVLHYAVGQEFRAHHDFLDPRVPSFQAEISSIGQRHTTFLVFLSDDFEGGETEFPLVGYKFKGRKGDAIMFRNVDSAGQPDYRTLHAGLPPTAGEKWLLSQWIRGQRPPENNWGME